MSNFLNKIPVSPITSFGNPSVPNGSTIGTNFSILQTGGYMEVYTLSGLTYTIPPATTGIIEFSGNSIPIQFTKGSGSVFSPDVLTLNSDNISSGRRKLGMLAYVYGTNKIYQFRIDNYDTLWNSATGATTGPGGPTVVISNFGTTVKNNTPEGQAFINAWTASTISGIGGYDDTNASWRVLSTGGSGGGTSITGGTFDNNTDTLTLNNSTGGTITITGFTDYYVTGGTYANDSITFTNNSGGTFNVTGITTSSAFTGGTVTGATNFTNGLTANTISATTYQNLPTDIRVTGGTYSDGTTTFTNNTGGTFTVSGYFTGQTDNYITGGTFDKNSETLSLFDLTGGTVTITGFTDNYTTGFTFNQGNYDLSIQRNNGLSALTVNLGILSSDMTITGGTYDPQTGTATFTNNSGGTFDVTGFLTGFTDIYVTGGTFDKNIETLTLTRTDGGQVNVSGFTDVFVTGGTKTGNNVVFTNNTGGTFTITGFTDTFVTGATYSNNTFTYINNTGGTFSVLFNTMTGLTATTISATTYQNLPTDIRVTGGTYSASTGITTFRNNTGGTFTVTGYFTPTNDIYVSGGTIGNGPDTSNNKITLNRSDGNNVTLNTLVDIVNLTKSEMDSLISGKNVIRGKTYKISGCDTSLYYNGTDRSEADVYTTIYLMGLEDDKLSESGIGIFYTPKYDIYEIFVDEKPFPNGTYVIWGGFVWRLVGESGSYNSIDIFTLPNEFEKKFPFESSDEYYKADYNEQYDDIIYDYTNDRIIYRNEQNSNIVSTTYENINYWINDMGLYNPIRAFQWGHLVDSGNVGVIYNQQIINSYNENINYLGQYQTDFYFNNLSYQRDFFVEGDSYQSNFIFDNQSYQNDITITNASYQSGITLNNGSYQNRIIIEVSSYQNQITLNNNSYQDRIDIFGFEGYPANQSYFNFNNGSYQNYFRLESVNGKPSIQNYFNFNNNSYQINSDLTGSIQIRLDFTNNSGQSSIVNCSQDSLIFDSSTQINGTNNPQTNITIKNYDRDLSSVSGSEANRYFIHDLPTDNTTSVYIGKINNQLVQVTKPTDIFVTGGTYSGSTIIFRNNTGGTFNVTGITTSSAFTGGTVTGPTTFTNGLTANTISATTYQNLPATPFLPLSGGTVTGATSFTGGLTANTISATTYQNLPQDIFVTGGTYTSGNAIFTNNSGGTFNVTGLTTPFTGGTVSGATIFTNGLTATTISATTYQNLPIDVFVTGGTYTSGNAIFTNNSGGTFTVSGFPIGGGGGQIFYLNLSQSQNGNRLLSTTASTASEQSTGVTISNGVTSTISSFQSQPLNTTLLPGGIWSFYLHSYKQNSNASFNIFVELYKITSGGTQTLLFSTDPTPVTTNSPNPSMQLSDGYFSGTPLSVSDGVVAVVKATNTGNQSHTITLFTEGSQHYSYAVSTIPTQQGLTCDTLSGCSIIQTIQTDVSNKLDKSGGTITGNLVINSGLTATTISATTYENLPATPFLPLSGGTVTGPVIIKNNANPLIITTDNYSPGSSGNILYFVDFTGSTNGKSINSRSNGGGLSGNLILQSYGNGNVGVNKSTSDTLNYDLDVNGSFGATSVSATTYLNLPTDIRVTGGTYSNGTATFTNNTGGTFNVTGLYTGGTDVFVTGATKSGDVATFTNNTGGTFTLTGLTDTFVTGGTYSGSTIVFTNNSGGTFDVTGITSSGGGSFTGGTVSGATEFTGGLTANTISATTITSPSISPYGLIVATSIGYQNIF
jgi:hypothetical protein